MSWFSCCFTAKRKKKYEQQNSNQQLPKSKSQLKQSGFLQDKSSRYKNISKTNLPSKINKHSITRNQDYTEISDKTTGLKIHLTDEELKYFLFYHASFQMDYDDGISQNLTINTFNYKPKDQNSQLLYYQHIRNQQSFQKSQQKLIMTFKKNKDIQEFDFQDKAQQQPTGF